MGAAGDSDLVILGVDRENLADEKILEPLCFGDFGAGGDGKARTGEETCVS